MRANLPLVEEKLRARGMDPAAALGNFAEVDQQRRDAITRSRRSRPSATSSPKRSPPSAASGADATAQTEQTRTLKTEVESLEAIAAAADERLREMMQTLPNLPQDDVPIGKSEHDNRVEKTWGEQPKFDFPAKPHWEFGEALGILDFNRAAKISGSRFVVHFGQGARLERALANFMLDLHTREHGYTEVLPPYMVNSKSLFGTGQLPKFAEDLFHCDDKGPYVPGELSGHRPLAHPHRRGPRHQPLPRRDPRRVRNSPSPSAPTPPASAREAGSYGKDVRGMIRQHQFQKVELVKFTTPEDSNDEHERLTRHAETVLETPRPSLPPHAALHRRHGLLLGQDLRPRSLAPRPEPLPRDLLLLQLRGLPGPPRQHPLPTRRRKEEPNSSTPSTAAASPSAAPISPSSKTTSRPTAPSASPTPSSPT